MTMRVTFGSACRAAWCRAAWPHPGSVPFALVMLAGLLVGARPARLAAQTFYGSSGLVTVPTAGVLADRELVVGGGYMRDRWITSGEPPGRYYQWAAFGAIGLFDRFEIVLRVSGVPGARLSDTTLPYTYPIDRMVSVKGVAVTESEYLPALALGIQDIEGKPRRKQFNALYAVLSKGARVPGVDSVRCHVGFGSDLWDKVTSVSNDHRFVGLFAGAEVRMLGWLRLMAEYDAESVNVGATVAVPGWPSLQVALTGDGRLGATMGYAFRL